MHIDDYSKKLHAYAARRPAQPGKTDKVNKLETQFKASIGWDKLSDKAKLGTQDAVYHQLKTHAPKHEALQLTRGLMAAPAAVLAREKKREAASQAVASSARLTKELAEQRATNGLQEKEILRLQAELTSVTLTSQQAQAELAVRLSAEAKIRQKRTTESVHFQVANDLFSIPAAAIDKKGGLLKMMLSKDFAAPQNDDGVIPLDMPNLLAADFSLIVGWYEDRLPRFVSVETYERLLPYLDYLNLDAFADVLATIVAKPWSASEELATRMTQMELGLTKDKKAIDVLEGTFARFFRIKQDPRGYCPAESASEYFRQGTRGGSPYDRKDW